MRGQRLRLRPTSLWVESDPLLLGTHPPQPHQQRPALRPAAPSCCAAASAAGGCASECATTAPASPPTPREAIFQEFVQLDNPERNRAKGLRLGLAIVRRLTDLLDHPRPLKSSPAAARCSRSSCPPQPRGRRRGAATGRQPGPQRAPRGPGGRRRTGRRQHRRAARILGLPGQRRRQPGRHPHCPQAAGSPPDIILSDHQIAGAADGLETIQRLRAHFGNRSRRSSSAVTPRRYRQRRPAGRDPAPAQACPPGQAAGPAATKTQG